MSVNLCVHRVKRLGPRLRGNGSPLGSASSCGTARCREHRARPAWHIRSALACCGDDPASKQSAQTHSLRAYPSRAAQPALVQHAPMRLADLVVAAVDHAPCDRAHLPITTVAQIPQTMAAVHAARHDSYSRMRCVRSELQLGSLGRARWRAGHQRTAERLHARFGRGEGYAALSLELADPFVGLVQHGADGAQCIPHGGFGADVAARQPTDRRPCVPHARPQTDSVRQHAAARARGRTAACPPAGRGTGGSAARARSLAKSGRARRSPATTCTRPDLRQLHERRVRERRADRLPLATGDELVETPIRPSAFLHSTIILLSFHRHSARTAYGTSSRLREAS
jgi:hypothetical protein